MKSHRRTHLQRSIAAGLAAAALAAPAAQAAPILEPGTQDTPGSAAIDVSGLESQQAPPVTTTIDQGFDWGSAAIGAGGAAALVVLVSLAGFKLMSRDQTRVAH